MSMLSIPSYKTDDPNYRYKMPRLIAKVEGRGNGIRTNIVNMGDIARALKRPPDYPTKFCGHELGAQSKFDPSEGKAIVNGAHTQQDLQVLIDKFIDKFVLCENCKLPEIDLVLKKNSVAYRCNACGNQGQVDNRHKLATFILKNPPDGGESTLGSKKKKSKSERQKDKLAKSKSGAKPTEEDDDNENVSVEGEEKKAKKLKKVKKTKKSTSKSKETTEDSDNDDTSGEGKSKKLGKVATAGSSSEAEDDLSGNEAVLNEDKKSRKSSKKDTLPRKKEELFYNSPEVKTVIDRLLLLFTSPEEERLSSAALHQVDGQDSVGTSTADMSSKVPLALTAGKVSPTEFFNQLRLLQISQDFDHRIKVFIALEVLFSVSLGGFTLEALDQKMPYLTEVTRGMSERDVLTVFEEFLLARLPTVTPEKAFGNFPYILQKLYNAEILDEDGILKHYSKPSKNDDTRESYVLAKTFAKPFLDWLQEDVASDSPSETDTNAALPSVATATISAPPVCSTELTEVKRTDDATHREENVTPSVTVDNNSLAPICSLQNSKDHQSNGSSSHDSDDEFNIDDI